MAGEGPGRDGLENRTMTTANDVTPLRIERSAYQFSAVRALIAQKETALRTGLRSALSDWGFRLSLIHI